MVHEAEANADADAARKAGIELKNEADSLVYSTEKSVVEYGDKLDATEKEELEQQMTAVKEAAAQDEIDNEDLKAKVEALQQASMKIGEKIYKDAGAGDEGSEDKEGETVDAEYKDKDEEKK